MNPIRIDADEIEQTLASPGWRMIEDRIRVMIEQQRDRMENAEVEAVIFSQGRLRGCRDVLALPSVLIAEARGETVSKRK